MWCFLQPFSAYGPRHDQDTHGDTGQRTNDQDIYPDLCRKYSTRLDLCPPICGQEMTFGPQSKQRTRHRPSGLARAQT
jgi:hypothetical protein